jgi:RNase P/RNase MRP subunit p30
MAAAKNRIKVNVITFLNYQYRAILAEAKEKGGYWKLKYEDYYKYQTYKNMLQKIDKIEDLKSIQRKINSLTHLIPTIGGTLEYLESLSAAKEEKVTV